METPGWPCQPLASPEQRDYAQGGRALCPITPPPPPRFEMGQGPALLSALWATLCPFMGFSDLVPLILPQIRLGSSTSLGIGE